MKKLLVLLSACSSGVATVANHPALHDPLLGNWQPDYIHPFTASDEFERRQLERVSACHTGEHDACWRAGLFPEVEASCRSGHVPSCRALGDGGADLPGAIGRNTVRCVIESCDGVGLLAECAAGFSRSCTKASYLAAEIHIPFIDDVLLARATMLAEPGCRQGMPFECNVLLGSRSPDVRLWAEEELCRTDKLYCTIAAHGLLIEGQRERSHRVYEYACQIGEFRACVDLSVLYGATVFPEPVPGRGRRLLEWYCRSDEANELQGGPDAYRDCMQGVGRFQYRKNILSKPVEEP